jgi:glycosyltransferase involved in cell wall biosynthesis
MLTKVLGPNDLQIVLCPAMERGLRAHYGRHLPLAVMPSTIQLLTSSLSAPVCPDPPLMKNCFVIGHLSNLQIAKGLDLVIDVFRALRGRGRDVRLILAGPIDTNVERQMIADAQAEFGDLVDYRGPVYGADKEAFFRDIHAIVYPTRNDAQPLVIMEAFSHGRPVISYGRGCIPDMLPIAAWLVPPDADFVMPAADQLERWINSSSEYVADGQRARKAFDAAIKDARIALDSFVHWVCLEPDHGFVRRGVDRPTLVTLEV